VCGICCETSFDDCATNLPATVAMTRSPAAKVRGLIDPGYVDALLADHRRFAGQGDRLWHLGMLEMWLPAHGIGG
jgi:hypothetical protein